LRGGEGGDRIERLAEAGHLEGPILDGGFGAIDLAAHGAEAEHIDLDFPFAGSEIELVPALIVGVSGEFGATLTGSDGCAGDELIGGADGTAMLSRGETPTAQHTGNKESTSHGNLSLVRAGCCFSSLFSR
jgi:hypothetical protein